MTDIDKNDKAFEELVVQVIALIDKSLERIRTVVNTTMVYTNYCIGYYIVEFEQHGHSRAAYGKETLKKLSRRLTDKYGGGWSVDQLENIRKFFLSYSESLIESNSSDILKIRDSVSEIDQSGAKEKSETVSRISMAKIVNTVCQILGKTERCGQRLPMPSFSDVLSWSHYLVLCKEKNDALVELTLPKDANIYAAEYALYLPDKKLLQSKLKEWIDEEEARLDNSESKDSILE